MPNGKYRRGKKTRESEDAGKKKHQTEARTYDQHDLHHLLCFMGRGVLNFEISPTPIRTAPAQVTPEALSTRDHSQFSYRSLLGLLRLDSEWKVSVAGGLKGDGGSTKINGSRPGLTRFNLLRCRMKLTLFLQPSFMFLYLGKNQRQTPRDVREKIILYVTWNPLDNKRCAPSGRSIRRQGSQLGHAILTPISARLPPKNTEITTNLDKTKMKIYKHVVMASKRRVPRRK